MSDQKHITVPCDLTILTVLSDGRHLWFTNIVREGDSVEQMTAAHCAVRRFYHSNIAHFVVVVGTETEVQS